MHLMIWKGLDKLNKSFAIRHFAEITVKLSRRNYWYTHNAFGNFGIVKELLKCDSSKMTSPSG